MSDVLAEVLTDLDAESAWLDRVLAGLSPEQWRTPTPAPGWDVAHQVAHLAWTDRTALLAATDRAAWDEVLLQALRDPVGFVDAQARAGASAEPEALLRRWRASRAALAEALRRVPEGTKLPWFGPALSATSMATARLMETWAHGLDVAEGLGLVAPRTDRVRHVVFLGVAARSFAYSLHGLPAPTEDIRVELTLPSGARWEHGPEDAAQRVSGSAYDFALRVTRRRHRDDLDLVAVGAEADRWLDLAQAFAGPPGAGRAPAGPPAEGAGPAGRGSGRARMTALRPKEVR